MNKCLNFLVFCAFLTLVSCSSSPTDIRKRVRVGMDKSEVLEILGNPSRSKRVKGADRWDYDMYDENDRRVVNYVYFKSGRVSYVGRDDEFERDLKKLNSQKKQKPESTDEFREL